MDTGVCSWRFSIPGGWNVVPRLVRSVQPVPKNGGNGHNYGYRPLVVKSLAIADMEMEIMKRTTQAGMDRSRVVAHSDEHHRATEEGLEDEVMAMAGLERDGKKLLWYRNKQTGENLLHLAMKAGKTRLLKRIVKFMNANDLTDAALLGDKDGNTALHLALQHGRRLTEACCLIKAAPRAVYQVNHKGVSPLYLAVNLSNHHDIVGFMLGKISENRLLACAKEILLHPKNAPLAQVALKSRSLGTLQTLMDHLPELISTTCEKGWRPLSFASNKGYLEEVTYFLTNFPKSAETLDKDGSFPIHKAVAGGHISIVQAFLAHCPQALHHIDGKGRTVLHIAARYARDDIFAYLRKETNKMKDSFLNLRDIERG